MTGKGISYGILFCFGFAVYSIGLFFCFWDSLILGESQNFCVAQYDFTFDPSTIFPPNLKNLSYECFAFMYVCVPHACLLPSEDRRGGGFPRTGVMGGCKPTGRCWNSNRGPQQGKQGLQTAEPSLDSEII